MYAYKCRRKFTNKRERRMLAVSPVSAEELDNEFVEEFLMPQHNATAEATAEAIPQQVTCMC